MSISSIKRHNHRVHSCEKARKQELLQHLITLYSGKSILVVSSANTTTTEIEDKNLTLSNDKELSKMGERQWDVLISFDLPKVSEDYLVRLSHAQEMALILIDNKEQTLLYPIETLVGKNLPREVIPGFEIKTAAVGHERKKSSPHRPTASQKRSENEDQPKFVKDSKEDKKAKNSLGKKEWDKPKGDKKPFEKKSWDKPQGDKRPWENSSSSNDYRNKKETAHTSNKPARKPRVIKIPSENKSKES